MANRLLIASAALALAAGLTGIPNKANAHAWWLWPAFVAGTAGNSIGTAAMHNQYQAYYGPHGTIRVRPLRDDCRIVSAFEPNGTDHREVVCD